jgi:hypothetical protein
MFENDYARLNAESLRYDERPIRGVVHTQKGLKRETHPFGVEHIHIPGNETNQGTTRFEWSDWVCTLESLYL